jgi:predicted PurR-regulated permease PerM
VVATSTANATIRGSMASGHSHPGPDEPSIQAPPTHLESRFNDSLARVANILTSIVAVLLIVFVVIALLGVVIEGVKPIVEHRNFTQAAVQGVNSAFLAIILLELVHTTVSRGPMTRQLQEFLVIGVTVGVRSGLEVAAGAGDHNARDVAINLAINALGVLILVAALVLLRRRLHMEGGHPGHPQPGYTPIT